MIDTTKGLPYFPALKAKNIKAENTSLPHNAIQHSSLSQAAVGIFFQKFNVTTVTYHMWA